MHTLLANTLCFLFHCLPQPGTCVCARCGRICHLWVEIPTVESPDYEFRGMSKKGEMIYTETTFKHYTCSRCGESRIQTFRQHVRH